MNNVLVIVPTYKPKEELFIPFIKDLKTKFKNVLIINDGSGNKYKKIFNKAKKLNILYLEHDKNYGKGSSLKTGYKYALDNNYDFTVACDCDGQHSLYDTYNCALNLLNNPDNLILGVRDFYKDNVPIGSKFGNILTRNILKIFINYNITDTQTGLRGQGKKLMNLFLNIKGNGFDFENNMLVECKKNNINLTEVVIDTIYINNNETTNFKPIKDSIKIYKNFIKYIIPSILYFIFDIIFYNENNILLSTFLNMVILNTLYYLLHDRYFYKGNYLLYTILLIITMLLFTIILLPNIYLKILLDIIIFTLFSYIKHKYL